jgi:hypothetical protein
MGTKYWRIFRIYLIKLEATVLYSFAHIVVALASKEEQMGAAFGLMEVDEKTKRILDKADSAINEVKKK